MRPVQFEGAPRRGCHLPSLAAWGAREYQAATTVFVEVGNDGCARPVLAARVHRAGPNTNRRLLLPPQRHARDHSGRDDELLPRHDGPPRRDAARGGARPRRQPGAGLAHVQLDAVRLGRDVAADRLGPAEPVGESKDAALRPAHDAALQGRRHRSADGHRGGVRAQRRREPGEGRRHGRLHSGAGGVPGHRRRRAHRKRDPAQHRGREPLHDQSPRLFRVRQSPGAVALAFPVLLHDAREMRGGEDQARAKPPIRPRSRNATTRSRRRSRSSRRRETASRPATPPASKLGSTATPRTRAAHSIRARPRARTNVRR